MKINISILLTLLSLPSGIWTADVSTLDLKAQMSGTHSRAVIAHLDTLKPRPAQDDDVMP